MKVLLANDSSSHAKAAANYLAAIPFRKPIEVDIVSAVAPPILIDTGVMGMPTDLGPFIKVECEAARERVDSAAVVLQSPLIRTHAHVPVGSPEAEIINHADRQGTDLIVLGAVGHSALERVMLGSVSDYVATHADASTLIVRPPRDSSIQPKLSKVLVALSGRPEDHRVLDWLGQWKLRPTVEVHLVRILQIQTIYRQDIRQKAADSWTSHVREAQAQILELESKLLEMGLNTETHLVEAGHIGEALINYAEEHGCDLIMTGDSDSGLLTRLLMGSTSRYVLRHSPCSVLIVRDKEDRRAARQQANETAGQRTQTSSIGV